MIAINRRQEKSSKKRCIPDGGQNLIIRILHVIDEETAISTGEFKLYNYVDSDALEALFGHADGSNTKVAFDVDDIRIILREDNGEINITVQSNSS